MDLMAIQHYVFDKWMTQVRYIDESFFTNPIINWEFIPLPDLIHFYVRGWLDIDEFEDVLDLHFGLRPQAYGIQLI